MKMLISCLSFWLTLRRLATGLMLVSFALHSLAQEAPSALPADLEQQVRQIALDGTHAGAPGTPRVEVVVGQLDPRLRLAPCARTEAYLPAGTRLWGRSRVGLRCTDGVAKWNVYLPITVKVFGRGLVTTTAAPAGGVLSAADLVQAEVDLAEDSSAVIVDAGLAVGRTLQQPLKAGQSLRVAHLRPRQWFMAGETVKVLAQGPGFNVESEAQAMTNGIEGQPARVRTESGRVLTGQPVGERQVVLSFDPRGWSPSIEGLETKPSSRSGVRRNTVHVEWAGDLSSPLEIIMKIGNPADKPVVAPTHGSAAGTSDATKATPADVSAAKPSEAPEASAKIELSSTTSTLLSGSGTAEFDADKVARISQSFADGTYKVHPEVIADKLIANATEVLGKARH